MIVSSRLQSNRVVFYLITTYFSRPVRKPPLPTQIPHLAPLPKNHVRTQRSEYFNRCNLWLSKNIRLVWRYFTTPKKFFFFSTPL